MVELPLDGSKWHFKSSKTNRFFVMSPNYSLFNFPSFIVSSANATPEFEGRGGEELGVEISNTLYRVFNNKHSIDLKRLCISPGEHCWVLYVDVLVRTLGQSADVIKCEKSHVNMFPQLLQCDGNLYDAISIAIKAALFNTK